MQVAIAGGNGFVGRHLAAHLAQAGVTYRTIARPDLDDSRIDRILVGCDALVNCIGEKVGLGPDAEFANVELPSRLYRAARRTNVAQFVQIGSVAAVANASPPGRSIDDHVPPMPETPYGISKLRGDKALGAVASASPILTILRPPILVGPDAPGVFALLRRAAKIGIPLPLAGARNVRSFMHVDNLAAAILAAIKDPQAGAFIVTDSAPITTERLYRDMLAAAGHGARLFPIGKAGRMLLKRLLGRRGESLFGEAAFDGRRFAELMAFHWPVDPDEIVAVAMSDSRARS